MSITTSGVGIFSMIFKWKLSELQPDLWIIEDSALVIKFESFWLIMFIWYTFSYNHQCFFFFFFYYKHQILRDLKKLKRESHNENLNNLVCNLDMLGSGEIQNYSSYYMLFFIREYLINESLVKDYFYKRVFKLWQHDELKFKFPLKEVDTFDI